MKKVRNLKILDFILIAIVTAFIVVSVIDTFNFASYADKIQDTTKPVVNVIMYSSDKIIVKSKDDTGIKALFIDGKRYDGASGSNVEIILREDNLKEMIRLHAEDYAGNTSDIIIIANPYYVGHDKEYLFSDILLDSLYDRVLKVNIDKNKYIYPISVENKDGKIIKYFAINSNSELDAVLLQENNNIIKNITKYRTYYVDVKNIVNKKSFISVSERAEDIVKSMSETIDHTKYGFVGKLTRVVSSMDTETNKVSTRFYTDFISRTYTGLTDAEMTFVPKTITDRGLSYDLFDVVWVNNSENIDEPNNIYFTAHATYSRGMSEKNIDSYKTTINYSGVVAKLREKSNVYAIEVEKDIKQTSNIDVKDKSNTSNKIVKITTTTTSDFTSTEDSNLDKEVFNMNFIENVNMNFLIVISLIFVTTLSALIYFILKLRKEKK